MKAIASIAIALLASIAAVRGHPALLLAAQQQQQQESLGVKRRRIVVFDTQPKLTVEAWYEEHESILVETVQRHVPASDISRVFRMAPPPPSTSSPFNDDGGDDDDNVIDLDPPKGTSAKGFMGLVANLTDEQVLLLEGLPQVGFVEDDEEDVVRVAEVGEDEWWRSGSRVKTSSDGGKGGTLQQTFHLDVVGGGQQPRVELFYAMPSSSSSLSSSYAPPQVTSAALYSPQTNPEQNRQPYHPTPPFHNTTISPSHNHDVHSVEAVRQSNAPWHLARICTRQHTNEREFLYNTKAGNGVDVYVLDTGVNVDHPEFGGRATVGTSYTNDGDGDGHGHGTHVAGIVGSSAWGVAKKSQIISVKVMGNNGNGPWSNVVSGINWVFDTAKSRREKNGRRAVMNLSLIGPPSRATTLALQAAYDSDIVPVLAAGNDRSDACGYSPADFSPGIVVGATAEDDAFAKGFSNFGKCVSVLAPGEKVTSASHKGGSTVKSGTSMATPSVSGSVAVILSQISNASPRAIKKYVTGKATKDVVSGIPPETPNVFLYLTPRDLKAKE